MPLRQPTRWTRRRLGLAGLVLVILGGLSASVGVPFGSRGDANDVPLNSVAEIDPATGSVLAKISVGLRPKAIASGTGVWVANTTDRSVSQINPVTGVVDDTVLVGEYPSDLAAAQQWLLVASAPLGRLVKIDTSRGNQVSPPRAAGGPCAGVRAGLGSAFEGAVVSPAPNVWFGCDRPTPLVRLAVVTGIPTPVGTLRRHRCRRSPSMEEPCG